MFIKSLIYITALVIIGTLNRSGLVQAESYSKNNKMTKVDVSPETPSELESSFSRMRRDIGQQSVADESDIPKDQLYEGSLLRTRRETAPGEPDLPKELQTVSLLNRAKRQMPSPPAEIPMPPM